MNVRPTATLAELYAAQGHVGKARAIYRELAESPDEEVAAKARRRLGELGPSAGVRIEALLSILQRVRERRGARAPMSEA